MTLSHCPDDSPTSGAKHMCSCAHTHTYTRVFSHWGQCVILSHHPCSLHLALSFVRVMFSKAKKEEWHWGAPSVLALHAPCPSVCCIQTYLPQKGFCAPMHIQMAGGQAGKGGISSSHDGPKVNRVKLSKQLGKVFRCCFKRYSLVTASLLPLNLAVTIHFQRSLFFLLKSNRLRATFR